MQPSRESWVDIAKGIAIVLVVFFHAVLYSTEAGLAAPWSRINSALDTFRMPLFFFMSGLMATRAVQLPYPTLFRRRILRLLYLYVLWCALQHFFFVALPPFTTDGRKPQLEALLKIFIVPNENLWFIYALPLFFTFAWLIRHWPGWLQIGLAAIISAAFGARLFGELPVPWSKTGRYLFFFILAVHLAGWVLANAKRVRVPHILALGLANMAVAGALLFEPVRRVPFTLLIGGLVAVAFGIALSVGLSRIAWFDWLRVLGTRTLPIYLVHTFPLAAVNVLLLPYAAELPGAAGLIAPPLLAALSIVFALLVHRWVKPVPGIFDFPIASWVNPPRPAVSSGS